MEEDVFGNPEGHGKAEDYPNYIVDQKWDEFGEEEHGTWNILFKPPAGNHQRPRLPGIHRRAECSKYR